MVVLIEQSTRSELYACIIPELTSPGMDVRSLVSSRMCFKSLYAHDLTVVRSV